MDQEYLLHYGMILEDCPPYQSIQAGHKLAYINFLDGWNSVNGIVLSLEQYNTVRSTTTDKIWIKIEERYVNGH